MTTLRSKNSSGMCGVRRQASALLATIALAGTLGCATPDPASLPARPALNVEIGPEFVLVDRPVRRVSFAPAPDGRLHLLAVTAADNELQHMVVGAQGVESRETVLEKVEIEQRALALPGPFNNLAAGFEADGTLRVVFREQHLHLQGGRWSQPEKGPPCEQLVRAGPVLHCLYRETGGEHAASTRLQWYVVPPLIVPIPIPQRNTKLLLACRSSTEWTTWAIVEPQEGRDVSFFQAASDPSGSVQIVYTAESTMPLLGAALVLVTRTPAMPRCDEGLAQNPLIGVAGLSSGSAIDRNTHGSVALATDPVSGDSMIVLTALAANSFMLVDGKIANKSSNIWNRNPLKEDFWSVNLKPAGGNGFHAVYTNNSATTHYLLYAGGTWSQPVQIFKTPSTLLIAEAPDRALIAGLSDDKKALVAKRLKISR
jgi:hypothetical protein